MFFITLSSTIPIPVSSTASFASGILALSAATAAAKKILSTCSCVYVENSFCAALMRANAASSASTFSMGVLSFLLIAYATPLFLLVNILTNFLKNWYYYFLISPIYKMIYPKLQCSNSFKRCISHYSAF